MKVRGRFLGPRLGVGAGRFTMDRTGVPSRRLGDLTLHVVSDGTFRLDGGAMFGVVPKAVWERRYPCDDRNRITLGLNTLLIRTGSETILVDGGIGTKWTDAERDRFGIDQGGTDLLRGLGAVGLKPEDVTTVVCTHLHFDHAGHCTRRGPEGEIVPTFPAATYLVRRDEYDWAVHANERTRGSYRAQDFVPLQEAGKLRLVDGAREAGDTQVAPGVRTRWVGGHTPFLQLVEVRSGGETALFLSDMVPTTRHLDWAWIMGYDVEPLETLRRKKEILPVAAKEGWLVVFEHDPETPWGRLRATADGRYEVAP